MDEWGAARRSDTAITLHKTQLLQFQRLKSYQLRISPRKRVIYIHKPGSRFPSHITCEYLYIRIVVIPLVFIAEKYTSIFLSYL